MGKLIWNIRGDWFAETPNGISDPWSCRVAAKAARDGKFARAWVLHWAGEKK